VTRLDQRPVGAIRLSVFGLGYVGCVSAACFASRGHTVLGVDANPEKEAFIREGSSPIVEERLGEIIAAAVAGGVLRVAPDVATAVHDTDMSIVCVGTPSGNGGGLSTEYLERVTEQIGRALVGKRGWHVVVYRSTMVPGTCEKLLIPLLERTSGKTVGVDFGVCVNPEYLREGSSVRDFSDPPKTVVGESDTRSGELVMALYADLPGPKFRVPVAVAEMTKYVDNGFHAVKVAFANEIGAICGAVGLDAHAVMDIFLADTKLNVSPAYLRPGLPFGGSCLPKDVRALTHTARGLDLDLPLLAGVLLSNETHLRRALNLVTAHGRRRIGLYGLSFKSGTDDLRESPLLELAERLLGKGYDVRIYDPNVALSRLVGANRTYLAERLHHISELLADDVTAVLEHADVHVVGSREPSVVEAIAALGPEHVVVDLVGMPDAARRRGTPNYTGIAW
jgi:GDP-mannose 6-dehydrogenase